MTRGFFITFEGGEGSGKSTQIARLARRLRSGRYDVIETREPGGTPLAEHVRALLLDHHPGAGPGPWSEAFLMEAARADLVLRLIRPALERGQIVLCDRFTDSTLAYQGGGRGLDAALLEAMNRAATGGLEPDLTLLFDLDPAIGLARRAAAGSSDNRLDREPVEFHVQVRDRYRELAARHGDRYETLDAALDADTLAERVWASVAIRLGAART
jgi:dTMP kinase